MSRIERSHRPYEEVEQIVGASPARTPRPSAFRPTDRVFASISTRDVADACGIRSVLAAFDGVLVLTATPWALPSIRIIDGQGSSVSFIRYLSGLVRAWKRRRVWETSQYVKLFPVQPREMYSALIASGFAPEKYRSSRQDLQNGLPSADWSAEHFIQFMSDEVKLPYSFPVEIDFDGLAYVAGMPLLSKWHKASIIRSLIQAQIDYNPDCVYRSEFWGAALTVTNKIGRPILFIGDSHSLIFRQTVGGGKSVVLSLNILCGGGSAIGLPNHQSRSQYGSRIEKIVRAIDIAQAASGVHVDIALAFGQVDIEFVYTYRSLRDKLAFDQVRFDGFCRDSATAYIEWMAKLPSNNISVVGINPPCVDDEFIREAYKAQMQLYTNGGIVDAGTNESVNEILSKIDLIELPNKKVRTSNHKLYNKYIQENARRVNLKYYDCFDQMIGEDGNLDRKYSCAADEGKLKVGVAGKDIHVGGRYAVAVKKKLIKTILKESVSE